ncbi:hypothetical protein [Oceanidesulfovibrio marinus]|uniref:Uncharacterized protein n=1 Tax=Oceanidesulfovibrio marinus TaxID=370038 RepID=A0ABX6NFT5_9BACT|nr:hypothetical protein [Oceanidesulfovibrio marinus]QJT09448.1 hypothetical protein E8L03_11080 [Oceanidesulfovibrio marinus]
MTDWTDPSNYDPDDLPPWERAAMRRASLAGLITPRRIFWAVAIVGLVIYLAANWQYALVAAGITGDTTPDQTATAPDQATTGAAMDRLMAIAEMDGNPMRATYNPGRLKKTSTQPTRRSGCICFCRNTLVKWHTCLAMSVGTSSQRWATL